MPVLLFSKATSEFLWPGWPAAGKGDKLLLSLSPDLETSGHQPPPLTTRIQTRSLLPEPGAGDILQKTQVRDWTERLPTRAATRPNALLAGTGEEMRSLDRGPRFKMEAPDSGPLLPVGVQKALNTEEC